MKVTLESNELLEAITLYLQKNGMKDSTFSYSGDDEYAIEVDVDTDTAEQPVKTRKKRVVKKAASKPAVVDKAPEKAPEAPAVVFKEDTTTTDDITASMEGKTSSKKARVFGNP